MEKNQKIVALVPLRGGSKGIPRKNIKNLAGKPLAYWSLKAAADSKYIDEVWVSTEDPEIKRVVLEFGLGIKVLDRPKELAEDSSSTESVMLHFAKEVPFDILVTLQATSPLTKSEEVDKALEVFSENGFDSMLSGAVLKKFFWTLDGKPLNYNPNRRPRRQEWEGSIMENGAFYITKRQILESEKCRLGGKIGIFRMPRESSVDIDEPEDFRMVAKLLKNRKNVSQTNSKIQKNS
jgi:N-acylneuraminate cytidylyltransferase